MKTETIRTFTLDNFEGSLDFLLHLIQKNEIDIYEISIQQVTDQYLKWLQAKSFVSVDEGAEFIGTAASLILLKSKMLLPKHEQVEMPIEEEIDPRFEIIHQLIDYCRFKDAAKALVERENQQGAFFMRGVDDIQESKTLGIEHLSLSDLAALFQQVLAKATYKEFIHEEEWRVGDKLVLIRQLLKELGKIRFDVLFSESQSREELIVTFLALLELMKLEELCVVKDASSNEINVIDRRAKSL